MNDLVLNLWVLAFFGVLVGGVLLVGYMVWKRTAPGHPSFWGWLLVKIGTFGVYVTVVSVVVVLWNGKPPRETSGTWWLVPVAVGIGVVLACVGIEGVGARVVARSARRKGLDPASMTTTPWDPPWRWRR